MDLIDPIAYVRAIPPFHALPDALFEGAVGELEIAFYPAGTWLVRAGGKPLERLSIIRRGAVRLEREGQTLQVLEEGETFGYTSLLTREATLDAVVEHDGRGQLTFDERPFVVMRDRAFVDLGTVASPGRPTARPPGGGSGTSPAGTSRSPGRAARTGAAPPPWSTPPRAGGILRAQTRCSTRSPAPAARSDSRSRTS